MEEDELFYTFGRMQRLKKIDEYLYRVRKNLEKKRGESMAITGGFQQAGAPGRQTKAARIVEELRHLISTAEMAEELVHDLTCSETITPPVPSGERKDVEWEEPLTIIDLVSNVPFHIREQCERIEKALACIREGLI